MTDKAPTSSNKKSRASISFPPQDYAMLEQIAARKKVSLAWVVRDAVEKYIADYAADKPRQSK